MTRKKPYAVWTKRHAAFVLLALFLAAVLIVSGLVLMKLSSTT